MDKSTKTGLYILGGAAVLAAGYYAFGSKSTSAVPPGTKAKGIPPGGSANGNNILNSLGQIIGKLAPPTTSKGTAPKGLGGGGGGTGGGGGGTPGPIGPTNPPVTQSNGETTYTDGSSINSQNQYVNAQGQVIGYVGTDGNLYTNNGNLIGDVNAGPNGLPDPQPEAQAVYGDGSYLDDNGYLHQSDGLVTGFVDSANDIYDNSQPPVQQGTIDMTTGEPDIQGPPEDQGNGYDQYGYPIDNTTDSQTDPCAGYVDGSDCNNPCDSGYPCQQDLTGLTDLEA